MLVTHSQKCRSINDNPTTRNGGGSGRQRIIFVQCGSDGVSGTTEDSQPGRDNLLYPEVKCYECNSLNIIEINAQMVQKVYNI